jgi:hypothetical protein
MSGLVVTVAAGRRQYQTRTAGGAYVYRVTQYYDAWPFGHDSRVPYGSKNRRRTETFRTLEPVRQRLARANGHAQYQRRNGGDWRLALSRAASEPPSHSASTAKDYRDERL